MNDAAVMTTTHNGREFAISPVETGEHIRRDMVRRGFDGQHYQGASLPTGRQRREYHGLFGRDAKTGEFVLLNLI